MMDSLKAFLSDTLVPLLKLVLDPLNAFLTHLPPFLWHAAVCLYLLAGCLWTLRLTRDSVYRGAPDQARWRDLRLWIPLLLVPYVTAYLLF